MKNKEIQYLTGYGKSITNTTKFEPMIDGIEVIIYETASGKKPLSEWLDDLESDSEKRILKRFNRIRFGNFGDCKNLGEAIYELRFDFDGGYRIYFGKDGNKVVIMLCGGDKKSQKKDIKKAQEYWRHHEGRKK